MGLWKSILQHLSTTEEKRKEEVEEKLNEMLKFPGLWSKDALMKAAYQGFDNYKDYEKYGDLFQEIKFDGVARFDESNYLK